MKKLKIYSTLLIVSLVGYFLLNTFSLHFYDEQTTSSIQFNDSLTAEQLEVGPMSEPFCVEDSVSFYGKDSILYRLAHRHYVPTCSFSVCVQKKGNLADPVLISHVRDSKNKDMLSTNVIEMESVKILLPGSMWENYQVGMLVIVGGLLTLGLFVWVMILVYHILRSVRSGEVFVSQVARYMHQLGWMFVGYYFFMSISSYCIYLYLKSTFQVAHYYIVYHNEANILLLILGFSLLIISQIILLGKDLKDEQELTI